MEGYNHLAGSFPPKKVPRCSLIVCNLECPNHKHGAWITSLHNGKADNGETWYFELWSQVHQLSHFGRFFFQLWKTKTHKMILYKVGLKTISMILIPLTWGYFTPVTHLVSAICRGLYSSIYNDRLGAHLVGIVPLKRSVGMLNRFSQLQNSTVTNVSKFFLCEGCFAVYKKRADCFWPLNPWDFRSMEI